MGMKFPNGAQFGFSTTIGSPQSTTAISNANPAVASGLAISTIQTDDVLLVQSSDPMINNLVAQAGAVTGGGTDSVALRGLDTSDTTLYDFAGDKTTLAVASNFVDFTQQGDPTNSGGEQQYWTGTLLEDRTGQQISVPTFKNAKVLTLPLYFDPALPWYAAARAADMKKQPVVLRCKLPDGDALYYYGYLSFDGDPSLSVNTPMTNTMTFTSLGRPVLVEAAT
jgi:hypothetical protein